MTTTVDRKGLELFGHARETLHRNEVMAAIKYGLEKRSGKTWSVTGGHGTAWGWIRISVPPRRLACDSWHRWDDSGMTCQFCGLDFRDAQRPGEDHCPRHRCDDTCRLNYISVQDRHELAALLGLTCVHPQGENIPSGHDYYEEYLSRAAGLEPKKRGQQYWD